MSEHPRATSPVPHAAPPAELLGALQAAVSALENVEEAVFVADVGSLAVLAVNRAGRELLDGRDVRGRPLEWLFPDEDPGEFRRRLHALVRAGGRSMGINAQVIWDDRRGRQVAVRLDVVRRDGVPLIVAFVRSTPEDRVLRAVGADPLGSLASRDDLLATLAAELRRAFRHGRDLSIVALRVAVPTGLRDAGAQEAAVLSGVAERLRAGTRAEEPLARIDRRSFAWLLPETGAAGARRAAERARGQLTEVFSESGLDVSVGVASLVRGDAAPTLLKRAEDDADRDPGPGAASVRVSLDLDDDAGTLLRAASEGDARAVEELVTAALARHGHARAYDDVLQRVMIRLGRAANEEGPERSAGQYRAAALLEWAVARRRPVHPPPDGPVAVLVPLGVDARRVSLAAAMDACAAAGWMPLELGLPTAAEATRPIGRLGARAVIAVIGSDTDLLDAAHLLQGIAESDPRMPLFVMSAPRGILRRWRPPHGVHAVESAALLVDLMRTVGEVLD